MGEQPGSDQAADAGEGLPAVQFTLEFEAYFFYKGNEGYYLNLQSTTPIQIRVNVNYISYKGENSSRAAKTGTEPGWRKIALSFNKRAVKMYLKGERLVNVPNATEIDFHGFLTARAQNPMANQFLDITRFRELTIDGRADIVRGDWDMCFPFAALYTGDLIETAGQWFHGLP